MFETQKNFENKEQIKDYTSKIELIFMRHDEKENDKTKSDEEVNLTSEGKMHAKDKAWQDNISQSMAFGSSRKRTQETAGLVMSGKLKEITGNETLEELKSKLDKNLPLESGSKIKMDERLNFKADISSNYGKKALEAVKNKTYLKFLVEASDKLAKEENDYKSSTYASQARSIASIVQKYYGIAPRFNEIVQDKNNNYEDTLKRFFGSHQGVLECFLAKIIEKTKGVEQRDKFVQALNNQGFDYAEGFDIEIKNKESGEPTIHILYKKEKEVEVSNDGKVARKIKTVFEFDEDVDKEILLSMAENNKI